MGATFCRMASIRVDARIYEALTVQAARELRSVASLASVLLREGLSERESIQGAPHSRPESPDAAPGMGPDEPAIGGEPRASRPQSSGLPRRSYAKDCRNSDYHWKGPCRWCGGGEPA